MSLLYTLNSVGFQYGRERVLEGIDLTIERGEILGIIGPNGSGKTTLLKILGRHLFPMGGEIRFEAENIQDIPRRTLAQRVSMVPQEQTAVFPYTVLDVVLMGRYPYLSGWSFETAEDYRIARSAMERMGIDRFAGRLFTELSGGEKQRVIIARALTQQPDVLLLDEPATFLDLRHQAEMHALLQEVNRRDGMTTIVVSHDLNMASQLCGRLLLLDGGRIAGLGTPWEVLTERTIEDVYRCKTWVDSHPGTGRPRISMVTD
jgi:ABC-type cobalamin/Fe3+-siderophores transport system ATPase subunit